jgi:uncharacterized membrane protein
MVTTADPALRAQARSGRDFGTAPLRAMVEQRRSRQNGDRHNVGKNERLVSLAAGSIVAALGAARRGPLGLLMAGVGGAMLYRGATGYCHTYAALGVDTAQGETRHGIHVSESFLIDKPSEELYAFWRNFENLPQIMTHLESVRVMEDGRSHWVAKAPAIVGGKVEWDAEITAEQPYQRIAWRSVPGSVVEHHGSVEFKRAPGDRGTAVRVEMEYSPPAGRLGHWVAKLFGEAPDQQIREDLRTFKRAMEVGEVLTIAGQPRGSCLGWGMRSPG